MPNPFVKKRPEQRQRPVAAPGCGSATKRRAFCPIRPIAWKQSACDQGFARGEPSDSTAWVKASMSAPAAKNLGSVASREESTTATSA